MDLVAAGMKLIVETPEGEQQTLDPEHILWEIHGCGGQVLQFRVKDVQVFPQDTEG